MVNEEDYKLSSDVGKLRLSAKDIYDYNAQEKKYNNSDPIINKQKLQDNFNANLIASDDIHSVTGFGAYALEDRNTHEIFIVYVGTQPS
ncbi:lipase, partial [Bacillus cereus]|nr:lipase [Bacillus cereus]